MKKIFLKLNMALIVIVVLFADISLGTSEYETEEQIEEYAITEEYSEESGEELVEETVDYVEDEGEPEWYEVVISWFIRIIGEGINKIISIVAGEPLSIDKLVFDQYSKTNLSFYKSDYNYYISENNPTGENTLVGGAPLDNLNTVFKLFRNIAIVVYMVVLVYMGLRVLIMTANAQKRAKYKELFLDWIKGIIILFFFPYIIRYTILLNHAFVTYLYDHIGNNSEIAGATIKSTSAGLEQIDDIKIDDGDTTETVDYMMQMYRTANSSRRISDAICWVIMLIQVIQFLIVYMKRLLTIIFLIAIFPLVTISYAVDKIGDGKSQAFDNWYKEFVLQVFIQSFHAVNYVLVMSIILGANANWFLKIIGVGYIAKGGDILRSLFAQMKGGTKGETGPLEVTRAYMKTKLAIEGVNTIRQSATKFLGKESMMGKGIERIKQASDGFNYQSALTAESKANKAYKIHYQKQQEEENAKDAKNVISNIDELKKQSEDYNTRLKDPTLNDEEKKKLEDAKKEVDEKIKNQNINFAKSVDNLVKLPEEELKKAVTDAGLSPEQISQLQATLNHAGAVGILMNSRNERNIDVRTAVEVVFKERAILKNSKTTGNSMLDRYISVKAKNKKLSDDNIRKINAAHSITIDDAARSARTNISEPVDTDARVDYAIRMFENAYKGEYGIDELTRSVEFIDSIKSNPTYEAKIKQMEKDAGFSFEDFKLSLAVQAINDSNRIENVASMEAQERIDDAIETIKNTDETTNKIILDELEAKVDELEKGHMPVLHEKESERSRIQREIAKTMRKENMLGRYGEDSEKYLDARIKETRRESGKLLVKGVAGTALGVAGSTAKIGITTASAGVSTGATYKGINESNPVIVGVAGTIKTVDDASKKIGKIGANVADSVIEEKTKLKVIRDSVTINRNQKFRNSAVNSAVDEEMKKRENLRNKMLNRKK